MHIINRDRIKNYSCRTSRELIDQKIIKIKEKMSIDSFEMKPTLNNEEIKVRKKLI